MEIIITLIWAIAAAACTWLFFFIGLPCIIALIVAWRGTK